METTTALLDSCAGMCLQCLMCTKKELLKIGVLILSFIFGTVDLVTDWINWNQWRSVGGYDQHYFVYIFQTTLLCVSVVGSVLWIIELFLIIIRSREAFCKYQGRYKTQIGRLKDNIQELEYSSFSERLGLSVRLLIGFLEDLPVALEMYHSVAMPLCGVPAKRESTSSITIATVISTMLNSVWTMFVLCWDLFGCNAKLVNAECCCTVIRTVYESQTLMSICYCGCCGCAATSNCGFVCVGRNDVGAWSSEPEIAAFGKSTRTKKDILLCVGRTILSVIICIIFLFTFTASAMTLRITYKNPILERSFIEVDPSTRSIRADKIGPGLDSRTDAATFINMVYELPNWYHVRLYDDRNVNIANSASVYQIQYIGQFEEMEHLKDGTVIKAIPCSRIFSFLDKIDESLFQWNYSLTLNFTDFSACKIIFRLRYHPTNNDWNPFKKFIHVVFKYITVEWSIYIQDHEICPTGFQPLPVSSLLTIAVKQDIINYTCSPSCINATDACSKAKYGQFEESQFEKSLTT